MKSLLKVSSMKKQRRSQDSVVEYVTYGAITFNNNKERTCSEDTTSVSDDSRVSETEKTSFWEDCHPDVNEMTKVQMRFDHVSDNNELTFNNKLDLESYGCGVELCQESLDSEGESECPYQKVQNLANVHKHTASETTTLTECSDTSDTVNDDHDVPQHCSFQGCGRGLSVPGWKAYNRSLDVHPVPTKAITSFCGWFLGDFITQTIITKGYPFDVHRSIVLSSFGLLFHGPVGHVIYDNLDRIIVGTGPREIVTKICMDQLLWCPVFMVCYFSFLGIANGDSVAMIGSKIKEDIFTAVTASWKIWPLAHAIQFRWVATKHRIIYINCIEVCFIMFLSFLANR